MVYNQNAKKALHSGGNHLLMQFHVCHKTNTQMVSSLELPHIVVHLWGINILNITNNPIEKSAFVYPNIQLFL